MTTFTIKEALVELFSVMNNNTFLLVCDKNDNPFFTDGVIAWIEYVELWLKGQLDLSSKELGVVFDDGFELYLQADAIGADSQDNPFA